MYVLFQFVEENLGVMSVGFLLSSPDDAVIWRGPKKNGECRKFKTGNRHFEAILFGGGTVLHDSRKFLMCLQV